MAGSQGSGRSGKGKGGRSGGAPSRAGPSLSSLGEFGLIRSLVRELGDRAAGVLLPEGDDAAVWNTGGKILASADGMAEGVHFRTDWTSPEDLGFKAISINVSDIAAMGGEPSLALVALGLPPESDPAKIGGVYRGMAEGCRRYGLKIGGGDTFSSEKLVIVVTILGEPPPSGAVTRAGAVDGDLLFVTGELGDAAAGLAYLRARQLEGRSKGKVRKAGHGSTASAMAAAVSRLLRPEARLAEGKAAAASGVSAMIDISDGIAGDALHLASASEVGILLRASSLPVGLGARMAEGLLGESPERLALCGGEDYELLVSVSPERAPSLAEAMERTGTKLTLVGEVHSKVRGCVLEEDGSTVKLETVRGYDHFGGRS